jgi:hypothetical protein
VGRVRERKVFAECRSACGCVGFVCYWSSFLLITIWVLLLLAAVRDAQWSLDGLRILTAGFDHTARLLDAETGATLYTVKVAEGATALRWHPSNRALFAMGKERDGAAIVDLRTRGVTVELKGMFGLVRNVRFRSSGSGFDFWFLSSRHKMSSSFVTARNWCYRLTCCVARVWIRFSVCGTSHRCVLRCDVVRFRHSTDRELCARGPRCPTKCISRGTTVHVCVCIPVE